MVKPGAHVPPQLAVYVETVYDQTVESPTVTGVQSVAYTVPLAGVLVTV